MTPPANGPAQPQCPTPDLHGNPFRYCPNCAWTEPARLSSSVTVDRADLELVMTGFCMFLAPEQYEAAEAAYKRIRASIGGQS